MCKLSVLSIWHDWESDSHQEANKSSGVAGSLTIQNILRSRKSDSNLTSTMTIIVVVFPHMGVPISKSI